MPTQLKKNALRNRKVAKRLSTPRIEFVSLVDHAANQQGFTVVKRKGGNDDVVPSDAADKLEDVTKKAEVTAIHKIVFKATEFPSEKDVTDYLDANGYEYDGADAVEKNAKGDFEVAGEAVEDFDDDGVRSIDTTKGVIFYAGNLKEDESTKSADDDDDGDEDKSILVVDGITSKSIVRKYDSYDAMVSGGQSLQDVMGAGNDGIPIGIHNVVDAYFIALKNINLSGELDQSQKSAAIKSLSAEFGDVVDSMAQMLNKISDGDMATKAVDMITGKLKKDEVDPEAARKAAAGDDPAKEDKSDVKAGDDAGDDDQAKKSDTDGGTSGDDAGNSDANASGDPDNGNGEEGANAVKAAVEAAVAEAIGPLAAQVTELSGKLDEAEEARKAAEDQIDNMKTVARARKSLSGPADPEPEKKTETKSDDPNSEEAQKAAFDDRMIQNMLGFRTEDRHF